ncbi:hypothetical protein AAFF_G00276560 [Aldrovandia affinis]|uniref:Uncharacterized protein n=1 Tax=Aldrovandia affinis TaxID=143900 RepID=A0AAD7W261_9TELE|nr:hypothetical protein AAFF_G00276560 [Aldrovandia affinis]
MAALSRAFTPRSSGASVWPLAHREHAPILSDGMAADSRAGRCDVIGRKRCDAEGRTSHTQLSGLRSPKETFPTSSNPLNPRSAPISQL